MKAILLAAGKGKRLRPITNDIPKCLLPINGKPLLEYWLDQLNHFGINEVLINGHYLAEMMEKFISSIKGKYKFDIHYVYEKSLLGTGGTVKKNYNFIKDEDSFLLLHGDNYTNLDLSKFYEFHEQSNSELTVALFKTSTPHQCGIVEEIDQEGRIVKFIEKPEHNLSNLANAASFILSPDIVKSFPDNDIIDFSKEILPLFQGSMYGFLIDGFNIDIGTVENYQLANAISSDMECQVHIVNG